MKKFESMCEIDISEKAIRVVEPSWLCSQSSSDVTITLPPAQIGQAITIKNTIAGRKIVIFGADNAEV